MLPVRIKYQLIDESAKPLARSRDSDMGYDVFIIYDPEDDGDDDSTENDPELWTDGVYTLQPGERRTFHTGMKVSTPDNYGFLLRDRSGLAVKKGLHVLAGVIEGTFRGEWKVCVVNLGDWPIFVKKGDKMAQAVLTKIIPSDILEVENLEKTDRGEKGFGSSGR